MSIEGSTLADRSHAVPGLSFTADVLAARRKTLGASEVAAVVGLNSRKSALDVYLEKTGVTPPFAGNEFTEWGLRMEQPIAEKYAEVRGVGLHHSENIVRPSDPWMSCTPDRIVVGTTPERGYGLEIKRFGDYREYEFGAIDTDEVPMDVAIQCHWSMMVTGLKRWDIAVLLGQADFRTYILRADKAISQPLFEAAREFWFSNVVARVQPTIDGSSSAKAFLKRTFKTHGPELIDPTADVLVDAAQLAELRAERKHAEEQIALLENRIKLAVGEHAGIRGVCTWRLDKNGRPAWKAIAEALGAKDPKCQPLITQHTSAPSRRFLFTFSED